MRSLLGCFIKEDGAEKVEDRSMYAFVLTFANHIKKRYYVPTKDEFDKWCSVIKELIGYSNLSDYYEIKVGPQCATTRRAIWARGSSALSRWACIARLARALQSRS